MKYVLIALLLFPPALSASTLILFPEIQGIAQADNKGLFNQIWARLQNYEDMDVEYATYPLKRALIHYAKNSDYCFGLSNARLAEYYLDLPSYDPGVGYYANQHAVYTLRNNPVVSSLNARDDLVVGHILGDFPSLHPDLQNPAFKTVAVVNHNQLIRMLILNRVDAILAASSDLLSYPDLVHKDENYTLFEYYESLTCQKPHPRLFKQFRNAVEQATRDGAIESIVKNFKMRERTDLIPPPHQNR